jgi:hypothetical protein
VFWGKEILKSKNCLGKTKSRKVVHYGDLNAKGEGIGCVLRLIFQSSSLIIDRM